MRVPCLCVIALSVVALTSCSPSSAQVAERQVPPIPPDDGTVHIQQASTPFVEVETVGPHTPSSETAHCRSWERRSMVESSPFT